MAFTSRISAPSSVFFDGQSKSGDFQSCQLTWVLVPKEALFMHGSPVTLPARTALRSAKNRAVNEAAIENVFGSFGAPGPGRDCSVK